MTVLDEIKEKYSTYQTEEFEFKKDIFTTIQSYFTQHSTTLFLLKKYNDPIVKSDSLFKVRQVYEHHMTVEILNQQAKPLFVTSINFSSLLDSSTYIIKTSEEEALEQAERVYSMIGKLFAH